MDWDVSQWVPLGAMTRYGLSVEQNLSREAKADPYRVVSVDRALRLLELVIAQEAVTVSSAAEHLGVAPSTAHRLLTTMAQRGFVEQAPRRQYRAGIRLAGTVVPAGGIAPLRRLLRPHLNVLYEALQETVHLTVLVGAETQFVDGIESSQTLRVGMRIGSRIPAYCTSGGKAVLAELDDAELNALHSDGLRPWPSARIRSLAQLRAELHQVRQQHFAVNRGESEVGLTAIGVSLGAVPGFPTAAISVAVPEARFHAEDQARAVEALATAAAKARRALILST